MEMPLGSSVMLAAILATTQWVQPRPPVGASGSWIVTRKLLLPLGAPCQTRCGETLPPLQPKPLNTCSCATRSCLKSSPWTLNSAAAAVDVATDMTLNSANTATVGEIALCI